MIARDHELIALSSEIEAKTAEFLASGGQIKTDLKSGLFTTGGFNNSKGRKTTKQFQASIKADIDILKGKAR